MHAILMTYALAGAVAGVLAGLLGIGGGLVIVPMLVLCFSWQQIPHALSMHLALGTSMASIIFTAASSFLWPTTEGVRSAGSWSVALCWASLWEPSLAPVWRPVCPPTF